MKEWKSEVSNKTVRGMTWKLLEKTSIHGVQIVIQIVLARLLLPEEYGMIGLLNIFITLSDVFLLQGLTTALIQKKDPDNLDFSSVFFANIVVAVVLYVILFVVAPYISLFYQIPELTSYMRVLSLTIIGGAFSAVHNAIVSRNLDFRKSFISHIASSIANGIVGVSLALIGFGAWSMILARVAGTFVGAWVLWMIMGWKPKMCFSYSRVKKLFSFSSKVLCTNLFNALFNNIHSLIIGKFFSATDVGFYQRGQQMPQMMMTAVDGSMAEVLYPSFSKMQDNLTVLKKALRKSISVSMYVTLPCLFGLLAISESFTLVLLTEKWLPSVPFMQLSCIVCMFWPLSHRTHALNAIGLSNVTLKLSLIGKSITLICIVVSLKMGVYALMLGTIFSSCINLWITSHYVKKHIGYKKRELAADVLPSLVMSVVMCVIVMAIGAIDVNKGLVMAMQILAGVVIYVLQSMLIKPEPYKWVMKQALRIVKK